MEPRIRKIKPSAEPHVFEQRIIHLLERSKELVRSSQDARRLKRELLEELRKNRARARQLIRKA